MKSRPTLLSASLVAPMDRPPIRDGAVVFTDRILAVGLASELKSLYPDALIEDRPGCVLLPGLINAHAHLELTHLTRTPSPRTFVDWLQSVMKQQANKPESFYTDAALAGIEQCTRFGVTTVGDISLRCAATRTALANQHSVRIVSFGEVLAMAQRRGFLEDRLATAADESGSSDFLRVGVSPHAPYSVEADGYRRCLEVARQCNLPLATHLAETRDEAEFLAHHSGPFRDLWSFLNAWDDHVPTFDGGPVRYAQSLGLLDYPTILAHVNYCDDAEIALLASGQASVVYCPRTHAYFGHPPHRWREMLRANINVAIGTDSCASSPDLNLVDDLRLLHKIAPEVPALYLWRLVTINAARALGMEAEVGTISVGKRADMCVFRLEGNDPLNAILESEVRPTDVFVDGRCIRPLQP